MISFKCEDVVRIKSNNAIGNFFVIPEQIAVGQAWQAFDSEGKVKDAKLGERFDSFARSLVDNTAKLKK